MPECGLSLTFILPYKEGIYDNDTNSNLKNKVIFWVTNSMVQHLFVQFRVTNSKLKNYTLSY